MKQRKILATILSIVMVCACPMGVYAADSATTVSNSTLEQAKTCADQLIVERTSTYFLDGWTWNKSTKIAVVVPMYDYDNHINAYLFRLNTNGIQQGYIVVNIIDGNCEIEAYGGGGTYAADIMAQKDLGHSMEATDKVIHHSPMKFIIKRNNKFVDMESNKIINQTENKLKIEYTQSLQEKKSSRYNGLRRSSSLDGKNSVSGLVGWKPFTTTYFGDPNNCGPTAGTNYINYWATRRSDVPVTVRNKLWSGSVYQDFKTYFHYGPFGGIGGSDPFLLRIGLVDFGSSRHADPLGSDERGKKYFDSAIDWAFITHAINSNIPLLLCTTPIPKDTQYDYHIFMVVGYNRSGSTVDLQTVTGWDQRTDNIYHYNNAQTLGMAAYARWA